MYSAKLSVSSLCVNVFSFVNKKMLIPLDKYFTSLGVLNDYATIRYDTRCYFNVRSKADISQLNLPHGTDN